MVEIPSAIQEGVRSVAMDVFRLQDRDAARSRLRDLLSQRNPKGDRPLISKAEYRYVEPFLWDRLATLARHDEFWSLFDEVYDVNQTGGVQSDDLRPVESPFGLPPSAPSDLKLGEEISPEQAKTAFDAYRRWLKQIDGWQAETHRQLVSSMDDDVANKLVTHFVEKVFDDVASSLPLRYVGLIRVPFRPKHLPLVGTSIELDDAARIVCPDEQIRGWLQRQTFSPYMSERQVGWESGPSEAEDYYLRADLLGYLPKHPRTSDTLVVELRDRLKAFIGLCIACDVLDFGQPREHEEVVMIGRPESNGCEAVFLPEDEAAVYGGLIAPAFDDHTLMKAKRSLHAIGTAFRRNDRKLLSAGRWFFGSHCGSNELLKLVQAITTLEIILGDEVSEDDEKSKGHSGDKPGLTGLLATRCAYLIATSRDERQAVTKQFKRIYDARSRAVHAGLDALRDDVGYLEQAMTLCRRVIRRELQVLAPLPDL